MPAKDNRSIRPSRFWQQLCESLIGLESIDLIGDERAPVLIAVTKFVVGQLSNLPTLLRMQLLVGLGAFQVFVLLCRFRLFESMPLADRCRAVESWATGPIPLTRKLFRPIRSLAVLAFFENAIVRQALAAPIGSAPVSDANAAQESAR